MKKGGGGDSTVRGGTVKVSDIRMRKKRMERRRWTHTINERQDEGQG